MCWDWVWSVKLHLKGLHLTPRNNWELGIKSVPWLFAETLTRRFRQKWQGQTPLQQLGTLNKNRLLQRDPCPDCWLRGRKEERSQNTHIIHALTEYGSCDMSFIFYGISWGSEWKRMNLSDCEQVQYSFFRISIRASQKKRRKESSLSQNIEKLHQEQFLWKWLRLNWNTLGRFQNKAHVCTCRFQSY